MTDKLLYFPYCDIPENSWTIKSLLYWDNVGVIVPPSFIENPNKHNKFTIDLLQTDLVEMIFPYNYVHQVKNFDIGFIELVESPKFNLKERQEHFSKGCATEIYIQKFGEKLLKHLIKMKIAQKKDWESYYVENRTANLIMIYLSTVIGKTGDFTPATDDIRNLDISVSQKGSWRLYDIRQKLLDELIPFPANPDFTKLRKFKDRFYNELYSFRLLLEQMALDISQTKKEKLRNAKFELQVKEVLDKKEKILSELNQSKFGLITFGTICGVVGAGYGFSQDNKYLAYFSLANAIYSAFQGYDNADALSKDFSYLALIDKKFRKA